MVKTVLNSIQLPVQSVFGVPLDRPALAAERGDTLEARVRGAARRALDDHREQWCRTLRSLPSTHLAFGDSLHRVFITRAARILESDTSVGDPLMLYYEALTGDRLLGVPDPEESLLSLLDREEGLPFEEEEGAMWRAIAEHPLLWEVSLGNLFQEDKQFWIDGGIHETGEVSGDDSSALPGDGESVVVAMSHFLSSFHAVCKDVGDALQHFNGGDSVHLLRAACTVTESCLRGIAVSGGELPIGEALGTDAFKAEFDRVWEAYEACDANPPINGGDLTSESTSLIQSSFARIVGTALSHLHQWVEAVYEQEPTRRAVAKQVELVRDQRLRFREVLASVKELRRLSEQLMVHFSTLPPLCEGDLDRYTEVFEKSYTILEQYGKRWLLRQGATGVDDAVDLNTLLFARGGVFEGGRALADEVTISESRETLKWLQEVITILRQKGWYRKDGPWQPGRRMRVTNAISLLKDVQGSSGMRRNGAIRRCMSEFFDRHRVLELMIRSLAHHLCTQSREMLSDTAARVTASEMPADQLVRALGMSSGRRPRRRGVVAIAAAGAAGMKADASDTSSSEEVVADTEQEPESPLRQLPVELEGRLHWASKAIGLATPKTSAAEDKRFVLAQARTHLDSFVVALRRMKMLEGKPGSEVMPWAVAALEEGYLVLEQLGIFRAKQRHARDDDRLHGLVRFPNSIWSGKVPPEILRDFDAMTHVIRYPHCYKGDTGESESVQLLRQRLEAVLEHRDVATGAALLEVVMPMVNGVGNAIFSLAPSLPPGVDPDQLDLSAIDSSAEAVPLDGIARIRKGVVRSLASVRRAGDGVQERRLKDCLYYVDVIEHELTNSCRETDPRAYALHVRRTVEYLYLLVSQLELLAGGGAAAVDESDALLDSEIAASVGAAPAEREALTHANRVARYPFTPKETQGMFHQLILEALALACDLDECPEIGWEGSAFELIAPRASAASASAGVSRQQIDHALVNATGNLFEYVTDTLGERLGWQEQGAKGEPNQRKRC